MSAQDLKDMSVLDLLMVIGVCAIAAWIFWALGDWARDGASAMQQTVAEHGDSLPRRGGGPRIWLLALGYGGPLVAVACAGFAVWCGVYVVSAPFRRSGS